jgi:AhpD family alkylhydroperoxidase
MALNKSMQNGTVSEHTLELAHLRASQINGCAFCIDLGWKMAKRIGLAPEKAFAVAAWRDSPLFNDEERAALALAEAMTRLSDREDAVPDAVWADVARHFDEAALGTLVLYIATVNFYNRINVTTRQVAGTWDG